MYISFIWYLNIIIIEMTTKYFYPSVFEYSLNVCSIFFFSVLSVFHYT